MTCSHKIRVKISGIVSYTICTFRIKVGGIGIVWLKNGEKVFETYIALFKISVEHAFGTRAIA